MNNLTSIDFESGIPQPATVQIAASTVRKTQAGKDYLVLTVRDVDENSIDIKVWGNNECYDDAASFKAGTVCIISGTWKTSDKWGKECSLQTIYEETGADAALFEPLDSFDSESEKEKLLGFIGSVEDPFYASVLSIFQEHTFFNLFLSAAGAKRMHHAFPGGLLKHTNEVVACAMELANALSSYKPNMDLVITGAILHDVGKVFENPADLERGMLEQPDFALRNRHLALGSLFVHELCTKALKASALANEQASQLQHVILAHHGRQEWGSPVEPATPEAMLVHLADMASCRVSEMSAKGKGKKL